MYNTDDDSFYYICHTSWTDGVSDRVCRTSYPEEDIKCCYEIFAREYICGRVRSGSCAAAEVKKISPERWLAGTTTSKPATTAYDERKEQTVLK